MDRLSKKCVITSGIVHGTLVLLLIVGPAFLTSETKSDTSEILTIIPDIATDSGAAIIGQGTPNGGRATPPPQIPKPPEPTPPPPQRVEPVVKNVPKDDPKPVDRTPKSNPESLEPTTKTQKTPIKLVPVIRDPSKTTTAKNTTAEEEKARAKAEAQKAAKRLETAMNNIRNGASSGVDIGPRGRPDGSGPSMARFEDILKSIYFKGWIEPSDATMEDAVVKVSVTIGSDGSVISARITKPSGDPAVDKSVQRLIESVTFITPFPEGSKEKQRTYPLSFSLKAKRSLG